MTQLKKATYYFVVCIVCISVFFSGALLINATAYSDPHPDFSDIYICLFEETYKLSCQDDAYKAGNLGIFVLENDGFDAEYSIFKNYLSEKATKLNIDMVCGTQKEMYAQGLYECFENGDWYRVKNGGLKIQVHEEQIDDDLYSVRLSVACCKGCGAVAEVHVDTTTMEYTFEEFAICC